MFASFPIVLRHFAKGYDCRISRYNRPSHYKMTDNDVVVVVCVAAISSSATNSRNEELLKRTLQ
jgi:hypothetical protein